MKNLLITALVAATVLLVACGKDESAKSTEKAAAVIEKAESMADKAAVPVADAAENMAAMAGGAATTIDHAKDEVEFEIKRHLAGLESLLEDVKDSDEIKSIKKEMAELQAKLDAM